MTNNSHSGSQQKSAGMIHVFEAKRQPVAWKQALKDAYRTLPELLSALSLSVNDIPTATLSQDFPLLVPRAFVARMQPGNPNDPLLRQILPVIDEQKQIPGYVIDPLAEHKQTTTWLHKYRSRVLITLTGGCAVNCRYCFRRHFPYDQHRMTEKHWQDLEQYLQRHPEVNEVIFSGGDPLLVDDEQWHRISCWLQAQPNIKRWRIHTRLPVVIPERITTELVATLTQGKPCVMVLHINHPNEIDDNIVAYLRPLREHGIWLLNQSVLLKDINDSADILVALSERLFDAGILPYYLHCLDKVEGAAHFDVPIPRARALARELLRRLPGFLVPRLVVEEPGKASKIPVDLRFTTELAKK